MKAPYLKRLVFVLSLIPVCSFGQHHKASNTATGAPFHEFILKDTNGVDIDSRSFRGHYTLIIFWASWCGPCRAEHPKLNALFAKYKANGFQMVGVSVDSDSTKWKEAIAKDALHWTQQVIESPISKGDVLVRGDLMQFYRIEVIPTKILIDKEGKIAAFDPGLKQIESIIRRN